MEPPTLGPSTVVEVAAVRQRLRQAMRKRLEANLLPYEGQWLTPPALALMVRDEKRKAWLRALELTILYLFGTAVSLLILVVLWNLVY